MIWKLNPFITIPIQVRKENRRSAATFLNFQENLQVTLSSEPNSLPIRACHATNPASLSSLSPVNLRDGRLQEVRRVPHAAVRGLQRQQEVRPQE